MDLFETPKIEFIEINDCDILSPINYCSHITLCSADFKYVFTTKTCCISVFVIVYWQKHFMQGIIRTQNYY